MFLKCRLTGDVEQALRSQRVERLIDSVGQDIVYGVSYTRTKAPKYILLSYAVKSLTGCVELIRILNRLGLGISYTQLEEIDTALSMYKLEAQIEKSVALPERIQPYLPTTLAWDNTDRLEVTLSGK